MTNKLTNRKALAIAIEALNSDVFRATMDDYHALVFGGQEYPLNEVTAKLEAMAAALENKADPSKRKLTPTQKENNHLRKHVMAFLTANPNLLVTCTDLTKKVPALEGMNNQKVSALMKPLVEAGLVTKVTEKGKSVFQLAKPAVEIEDEKEDGDEG